MAAVSQTLSAICRGMEMKRRRLIAFLDSGDTLVDEGSEYRRPGSAVVEHAELIAGAKEALLSLRKEGFLMEMVADGLVQSFDNVYRQHGLEDIFVQRTISEQVGEEKPSCSMFRTAMEKLGLGEEDKERVVMIGNNLKRDISGANRYGLISVLLSWSPRYCMTPEGEEEEPDYVISEPGELPELLLRLDALAEDGKPLKKKRR